MMRNYKRLREAMTRSYLEASIDDLEKKILSLQGVTGDSYGNPLDKQVPRVKQL